MNCLVYGELFIAHMLGMCLGRVCGCMPVCAQVLHKCCVGVCVCLVSARLIVCLLARSLACLRSRVHTIM